MNADNPNFAIPIEIKTSNRVPRLTPGPRRLAIACASAALAIAILIGCSPTNERQDKPTATPSEFIGPLLVTLTPSTPAGLIAERKILPPGQIGTFAYGAIVNDTVDVTLGISPEVLNKLSTDLRVGINAQADGLVHLTHFTDGFLPLTSPRWVADIFASEQRPNATFTATGTGIPLVELVRDSIRRRPITLNDILVENDLLNGELTLAWANVSYIRMNNIPAEPRFLVLPIEGQGETLRSAAITIVSVGPRFLQRINLG